MKALKLTFSKRLFAFLMISSACITLAQALDLLLTATWPRVQSRKGTSTC